MGLPVVNWQVGVTSAGSINSVENANPLQVAAEFAPIRIIYGTPRLPAQIANVLYYNGNWIVQVIWGEGPCTAVSSVTFNDETPVGGSRTDYLGVASPTVDATLVAAFALLGITYTDALPDICYSVFTIPAPPGGGLPEIKGVIQGRAVYDPRQNNLLYSEQFDNAAWTKAAITVTANQSVAPDGATTMDRLTLTGGNVSHTVLQVGVGTAPPDSSSVTHRYHARIGTLSSAIVAIEGQTKAGTLCYATYNLSTGVVVSTSGCTATIKSYVTDIYEMTMTIANVGTGASDSQQSKFYVGAYGAYNGDTQYVDVWGGQLTPLNCFSGYSATTSAVLAPVTVYSDCPVLIAADFASSTRYGMSANPDYSTVSRVANSNDELVSSEKRRTLSLYVEEVQDINVWLDVLCTYAGCWPVRDGSKILFINDRPEPVTRSFTHASGEILKISPPKIRDATTIPTCIEARHTNNTQLPWRRASQWAYMDGVQAGTYPRRESQIALEGIFRPSQALREATERLNKLVLQDLSCTLSVFDEALACQIGDVVAVTHPIGLAAKQFRIKAVRSNLGRHELDLLEYDSAVYSSAIVSVPSTPDTTLPNPLIVETPSGLSLTSGDAEAVISADGSVNARIKASWTSATDKFVVYGGFASVQYKKSADSIWIDLPDVLSGASPTWVPNVAAVPYDVRVRFENTIGQTGSWATVTNHTPTAFTALPTEVTGLTAAPELFGIRVSCDKHSDPIVTGYEFRVGASWAAGTVLQKTGGNSFFFAMQSLATYTFWVSAINAFGNGSMPVSFALVLSPAVTGTITPSIVGKELQLSYSATVGGFAIDSYEIRYGTTATAFAAATSVGKTSATKFRRVADYSGTLRWWVVPIDAKGNYGTEQYADFTINVPSDVTVTRAAEVIDNNVTLFWNAGAISAAQLPIDRYEVRRGTTWAGGTELGSNADSTFFTIPEQVAGTNTYWIGAYDTANTLNTPVGITATAFTPPDYVNRYNANSTFSSTKTNAYFEGGVMFAPFDTSQTWAQHFTTNAWTTIQNQIDAGYPIYIEPSLTTGSYDETFDFGSTISSSTTLQSTLGTVAVAGTVTPSCQLYWKLNSGDPWTALAAGSSALITSPFRYFRVVWTFTCTAGANVLKVTSMNTRLFVKLKTDSGAGTAAIGGTVVNFGMTFTYCDTPVVQANGAVLIPKVTFAGGANPTSFTVQLYNTSNTDVGGAFSWVARGYG